MDKLIQMHILAEVARQGSFSGAARKLKLSPSAVSKQITRMEKRLGSRLINRTTRKLSLTEEGQAFLNRCLVILDEIDQAEDMLSGYRENPRGVLTVNSSPGFAKYQLLPVIPAFLEQFPELTLNVQQSSETVDLISEEIDLAIRMGPLPDSSLVARKLGESRRIICASPQYLERHGEPKKPADLAHHNCLVVATSTTFNQWTFSFRGKLVPVTVSGNFVTDTIDAVQDLALRGLGIARLPEFTVWEDLRAGRLMPLLPRYGQDLQLIHAVFPHRHHLPARVRVFIDYLVERFSRPEPWVGSTIGEK